MSTRRSFIAAMIGGVAFARHVPDLKSLLLPTIPVPSPIAPSAFVPEVGDMFLLHSAERPSWLRSFIATCDAIDITSAPHDPVHHNTCAITVAITAHYHRMKDEGRIEAVPYDVDFPDDCYEEYPRLSKEAMEAVRCTCTPRVNNGFRQFIPGLIETKVTGHIGMFTFSAVSIASLPTGAHKFAVTRVECTTASPQSPNRDGYLKV